MVCGIQGFRIEGLGFRMHQISMCLKFSIADSRFRGYSFKGLGFWVSGSRNFDLGKKEGSWPRFRGFQFSCAKPIISLLYRSRIRMQNNARFGSHVLRFTEFGSVLRLPESRIVLTCRCCVWRASPDVRVLFRKVWLHGVIIVVRLRIFLLVNGQCHLQVGII